VGRPLSDPAVQKVIGRRRAHSAKALQVYRATHPN
jgi:hypothetical protein